jgi:hypothetical protein
VLSLAEVASGVYGVWRLAWFDAGGMRYLDRSLDGFWRSFRVAILAAPFTALLVALDFPDRHLTGGWFMILAGESIAYVIGWVAFPLLAYYGTEMVDRRPQYFGLIVAYNWSNLIQLAAVLFASLVAHSGILPVVASQGLILAADIAILVYEWFIFRTALALPGLAAAGFVLADVLVGMLVSGAGDYVARAG